MLFVFHSKYLPKWKQKSKIENHKCIRRIRTYHILFISYIVSQNANGFQTKHYFPLEEAAVPTAMAT